MGVATGASGTTVKNTNIVVKGPGVDPLANDKLQTYVVNAPTLLQINAKLDARFDDPTYY